MILRLVFIYTYIVIILRFDDCLIFERNKLILGFQLNIEFVKFICSIDFDHKGFVFVVYYWVWVDFDKFSIS